jgi:hypothetical protein
MKLERHGNAVTVRCGAEWRTVKWRSVTLAKNFVRLFPERPFDPKLDDFHAHVLRHADLINAAYNQALRRVRGTRTRKP